MVIVNDTTLLQNLNFFLYIKVERSEKLMKNNTVKTYMKLEDFQNDIEKESFMEAIYLNDTMHNFVKKLALVVPKNWKELIDDISSVSFSDKILSEYAECKKIPVRTIKNNLKHNYKIVLNCSFAFLRFGHFLIKEKIQYLGSSNQHLMISYLGQY